MECKRACSNEHPYKRARQYNHIASPLGGDVNVKMLCDGVKLCSDIALAIVPLPLSVVATVATRRSEYISEKL